MTVRHLPVGCAALVVVERTMEDMTAALTGDYFSSLYLTCKRNIRYECSPFQTNSLWEFGSGYA